MSEQTSEGQSSDNGLPPNPARKATIEDLDAQLAAVAFDGLRRGIGFPEAVNTTQGIVEWVLHRFENLSQNATSDEANQLYAAAEEASADAREIADPHDVLRDHSTQSFSEGPTCSAYSDLQKQERDNPEFHAEALTEMDARHTEIVAEQAAEKTLRRPAYSFAAGCCVQCSKKLLESAEVGFCNLVCEDQYKTAATFNDATLPPYDPSLWARSLQALPGLGIDWTMGGRIDESCYTSPPDNGVRDVTEHAIKDALDKLGEFWSRLLKSISHDSQTMVELVGIKIDMEAQDKALKDALSQTNPLPAPAPPRVRVPVETLFDETALGEIATGWVAKCLKCGKTYEIGKTILPFTCVCGSNTIDFKKQGQNPAAMPGPQFDRAIGSAAKLGQFLHDLLARSPDLDAPSAFDILGVCMELAVFLMGKNKQYGDSALDPVRILSSSDALEQIRVRMDDKLSRLVRGEPGGEDTIKDLVGYWVLMKVAEKRKA